MENGELIEPGTAKTSRPCSAANLAVINDPLLMAAMAFANTMARAALPGGLQPGHHVAVTGMHLAPEFGLTVREIERRALRRGRYPRDGRAR